MAPRVALPDADELRRLEAAYRQSLRYAEDVRRLYRQQRNAICQSLLALANALEAKDACTCGHSERVAELGRRIARELGLDADHVAAVGEAGLLHDVGTIGVPEPTLLKSGALTAEEWQVMRRHPLVSAQIAAPFEFFSRSTPFIRHHHERWDGSGYPDGLAGAAIPLGARIVAVADVFDALTSRRSYRVAVSREAAVAQLLDEAGRTLDAHVVTTCVRLLRRGGS
ncbi:MAG TPA: HD-GYP domain-containing protein [Methylomirabilota bacterium]|jgi:HD-GYP domain-containing protein (c-di-GMP phosphodiesterase class II)